MEKFKKLEEYDITLISIINMIPGHIYLKDKLGRYLWCNNQQVKTFNQSSQNDVIGKTDYELMDKETADIFRKTDNYVMQSGSSVTTEEPETAEDGSTIYYLSKKSPLYDSNNTIIGIIGSSFDLSEQKKLITSKEQNERKPLIIPSHI
ncbi:MAG TPA: PAS domain-containing protein [Gammaproteobacteria bacterium]|nr:PAS domain-containing protein [Gammaproteobacteria bacterium]